MNGRFSASATACGVVTSYIDTELQIDRERKPRPKRKGGYPGFRIRMLDFYVEEIRAVAECMGLRVSVFVYLALLQAKDEAGHAIGMAPHDIARLNKTERAEIRRKYRLTQVAMRGGSAANLERN